LQKKKTDELLNGVKPLRNNWLIRVKVLHGWKQNTSFGGDIFECVLADETLPSYRCKDCSILQKELIFFVSNVIYRRFWTILPNNSSIQIDFFRRHSGNWIYDELRNIVEKKNIFLKDVIGQVVDLHGVQTVQAMGKEKKKVQFRLRDYM
ncbi:hypothetical protein HID58_024058, partial [Brassica napus]